MTKEQLNKVVQYKMERLAATVMSAAEFTAKAAAVNRWAEFQSAYATKEA